MFLVDSLYYNLLFIPQLCENGYSCLFTNKGIVVFRRSVNSSKFKGEGLVRRPEGVNGSH
jgi:hypothetical protein